MSCYLDAAATTSMDDKTRQAINRYLNKWHNPNSIYAVQENFIIQETKKLIKNIITGYNNINSEVIFTQSCSHANQIVWDIITSAKPETFLISSNVEHKSNKLAGDKYSCFRIPINLDGTFLNNVPKIIQDIPNKYKFISLIETNNETGTIISYKELKEFKEKYNVKYIHLDCAQSFMKGDVPLSWKDHISFITVSPHKFNGPKGIGFLYINPITLSEVRDYIPYLGTPAIHQIAGINTAMRSKSQSSLQCIKSGIYEKQIVKELIEHGIEFKLNISSHKTNPLEQLYEPWRQPGILSIQFTGIDADELVMRMANQQIYLSTGSACSKNKEESQVLKEFGLSNNEINSTVRISIDPNNLSDVKINNAVTKISKTIKGMKNEKS